jgi:hypothetical protein
MKYIDKKLTINKVKIEDIAKKYNTQLIVILITN